MAGVLAAACCLLSTAGCVHRSLTIRTDPPGATVYVNGELQGTSPIAYDYEWYGGYRVLVRHPGYEPLYDWKRLRAPWYLWIPLDLVMDALPVSIRDDREWSYTLTPAKELPVPGPPGMSAPAATTGGS